MRPSSEFHAFLRGSAACTVLLMSVRAMADPCGAPVEEKRVDFEATLSDGQHYSMAGYFYTTGNPNHKTLQVLLHGGTYNHTYWDAPEINGIDYSYARHMARQGYAVLSLDLLGAGASSHPDGDLLTVDELASSVAQVLTALRSRRNATHHHFDKIVLVGHSLGARIAVYTMGTYTNAADALVSTGWSHVPRTVTSDPSDPQPDLSQPYITYPPILRTHLFYYTPSADPAMIAFDNAELADETPRGPFGSFFQLFSAFATNDIAAILSITRVDRVAVPVFVQLGENDISAEAAVVAPTEASFYASAPSVTIDTLPKIGHVFNLHRNHDLGWQRIDHWIQATVGE